MICHNTKSIFIHIPKTGGTSIEKAFGYDWPHIRDAKHHWPGWIVNRHGREIWDTYFKFTFVRNPWDRAISWLHYSKMLNKPYDFWGLMNKMWYGSMFGPQHSWYKGYNLDFIGRYENFNDDFKEISKLLGKPMDLPWLLKTNHLHYAHYYEEDMIEAVAIKEAETIKAFGYEFDK